MSRQTMSAVAGLLAVTLLFGCAHKATTIPAPGDAARPQRAARPIPTLPTGNGRLTGDLGAHDPSRITECHGKYFYYVTGPNIPMRDSTDLAHWTAGPSVLNGVPAWAHQAVAKADSETVWAPDVIFRNNRYFLYYSFSTFGSRISVIGLLTSPTLDPDQPGYHWTDQGEVIGSERASPFNAIDPCPVTDTQGGQWLSFGSWNRGGIQIVPLDKDTGKPSGPPTKIVAGQRTGPEGSFVWYHKGFYYVFENEGLCCQGLNSTYRIMMGRSKSITGPYLDQTGKDLALGGGTLFLGTDGRRFGPGQVGIYNKAGVDHLTFHYYDGTANGTPLLGLQTLTWGTDGWPTTPGDVAQAGADALEGHYVIISKATGLALSVQTGDTDGTALSLARNADGPMQQWNVSPTGDGCESIASLGNAKFVDLNQCKTADGTPIDQYPWFNNDCQRWRIEPAGDGAYWIVSNSSGNRVTAPDAAVAAGTPVQEFAKHSGPDQEWYFRRPSL